MKFYFSVSLLLFVVTLSRGQNELEDALYWNNRHKKIASELIKVQKERNKVGTLEFDWNWFWPYGERWKKYWKEKEEKLKRLDEEKHKLWWELYKLDGIYKQSEVRLVMNKPDKWEEYQKRKWTPEYDPLWQSRPNEYTGVLPFDFWLSHQDSSKYINFSDDLIRANKDASEIADDLKNQVNIYGIRKIIMKEYEVRLDSKKAHSWTGTFVRVGIGNSFNATWTGTNLTTEHKEEGLQITLFIPNEVIEISRPNSGTYRLEYQGEWKGKASWYHNENWYCTAVIHTQ